MRARRDSYSLEFENEISNASNFVDNNRGRLQYESPEPYRIARKLFRCVGEILRTENTRYSVELVAYVNNYFVILLFYQEIKVSSKSLQSS